MSEIPADANFTAIFWLKVERIRLLIRGSCVDRNIRDWPPPCSFLGGLLHIRIVESAASVNMDRWLIDVVGDRREEKILHPEDPEHQQHYDQDNPDIVGHFPDLLSSDRELLEEVPLLWSVCHVI